MSFDPTKQYRCTIIRGKAKSELDELLSKYANIIREICPCKKDEFRVLFNKKLGTIIDGNSKTIDNHRTEIAGKLFGMYYIDNSDNVYTSERTLRFLENEDQPEFFKDICAKFQFPNGMDSIHTIIEKISNKVNIRPLAFILETLKIADKQKLYLTKNEIGYFILNSLEVLQGSISPNEVLTTITHYRNVGNNIRVSYPGKASSFSMQHINEQIGLLELANLIRVVDNNIILNPMEVKSIEYISSLCEVPLGFDVYQYDLSTIEGRKELLLNRQIYFSLIDKEGINTFVTSIEAIQFNAVHEEDKKEEVRKEYYTDKMQLGDDGEYFIFEYEKERIAQYDNRLINKVLLLGRTHGLGYDIQSLVADKSERSEFVQYIEVKSTKRITLPQERSDGWLDSVTLTRNERIAAEQHGDVYLIYRVYFTPEKIVVYIIKNPYKENGIGSLKCIPISYRLDFSNGSIYSKFEKVGRS